MKPRRNRAGNIVWMSWKGEPKDAKPPHYIYGAGWDLCKCPYGQVGYRIWVRETWAKDIPANDKAVYRADGELTGTQFGLRRLPKWKPSIHMPRWASRITLEITGVRVERLQDISEDDALAQGADYEWHGLPVGQVEDFKRQWIADYGIDGLTANPWVWVIEFKRVDAA